MTAVHSNFYRHSLESNGYINQRIFTDAVLQLLLLLNGGSLLLSNHTVLGSHLYVLPSTAPVQCLFHPYSLICTGSMAIIKNAHFHKYVPLQSRLPQPEDAASSL